MNIAIVSAFRNAIPHLRRYFAQVQALAEHAAKSDPNVAIRVIAVEGDSSDRTKNHLYDIKRELEWQALGNSKRDYYSIEIITHNHGKREFSSTEDTDRLEALTGVMKAGLSAVDSGKDDVVLYVESDLIWHPHQVGSLIDMALRREKGFDIFAPMVWAGKDAQNRRIFYDIWGFRKNGQRFSPFYPYVIASCMGFIPEMEVDSAGSCLAFRAEIAEKVEVSGSNGLVSWCESARNQGYRILVASQFYVEHP